MIQKHAILTCAGIIISFGALYWIDPSTAAGQTVLVGILVLVVNIAGGLLWRD